MRGVSGRIIGLLIAMVVVAIASSAAWRLTERSRSLEVTRTTCRDKIRRAEAVIALHRQSLQSAAYSLADLREHQLVDPLPHPNPRLDPPEGNLQSLLQQSDIAAVWILGRDGRLVRHGPTSNAAFTLPTAVLPRIVARLRGKANDHFFFRTSDGWLEMETASVHPRGWKQAEQLLVCRRWDFSELERLGALLGVSVQIEPRSSDEPLTPVSRVDGTYRFGLSLPALDASERAVLIASGEVPNIRAEAQEARTELIVVTLASLAICAIFAWGLLRWIAFPLNRLSRALAGRDMAALATLQRQQDEFGELARLMVRYDRQSRALEAEVAERELAEAAQEAMALAMREAADARMQAEEQAALLQEQAAELMIARDQALESTRAKSEFLANMSHEIRTPINGIMGMTSFLIESNLNPVQQEYARVIESAAQALLGLISGVLDFSQLEAGRLVLDAGEMDLREEIESVLSLLAPQAYAKGLEIAANIDRELPPRLTGDGGRVRQILTNLVGNAIKFTERGEVVVSVRLLRREGTRYRVRLRVADTGIGIPQDKHQAIFESFTQVDGSTTRRYGGAGLGLSICRQLVRLMAGEISVESEPGHGSVFTVDVPLALPDGAASAPPMDPWLYGVRALVVDGGNATRSALAGQLAEWCASVYAVGSREEALNAVRAGGASAAPELMVIAQRLPDADGRELAARLRAMPGLESVPVVLLCEMGAADEPLRAGLPGGMTLLSKPIRQADLRAAIQSLRTVASAPGETAAEGVDLSPAPTEEGPMRLLLVEDNPINSRVLARMAQRIGYEVDIVSNGSEAVEAHERRAYAALLMDIQMPVMDGYAATAEIRAREKRTKRRVPIIAVTAHTLDSDRERCLGSGMDDYLAKPVDPAELKTALTRWAPLDTEYAA